MGIAWNADRMSTGFKLVDDQHQELIRRFNEFHDAMAHGKGQATAIRLLGFLAEYTETHFKCEEECMTQHRCPAAISNLSAHNGLRREIAAVKGHITEGKLSLADLVKVEQMLGNWIQTHICTIDVKLRECVGDRSHS